MDFDGVFVLVTCNPIPILEFWEYPFSGIARETQIVFQGILSIGPDDS